MFSIRPVIGTLLGVLLALAGCSSQASPSVPASRASAPSGSAGASAQESIVSAFDLEVGDCFNADDVSTVDDVTVLSCDASHVYEVFGLTEYQADDAAAFPGDDALNAAADRACRTAFQAYVGVAYDDSEWSGTFINPSEETWAQGDREILCVLHTADETQVTGSAQGSER